MFVLDQQTELLAWAFMCGWLLVNLAVAVWRVTALAVDGAESRRVRARRRAVDAELDATYLLPLAQGGAARARVVRLPAVPGGVGVNGWVKGARTLSEAVSRAAGQGEAA